MLSEINAHMKAHTFGSRERRYLHAGRNTIAATAGGSADGIAAKVGYLRIIADIMCPGEPVIRRNPYP